MLVKTVPSKWAAPTSFIKIPACLVAGKENTATLIHSGLQACIDDYYLGLLFNRGRTETSEHSPPKICS